MTTIIAFFSLLLGSEWLFWLSPLRPAFDSWTRLLCRKYFLFPFHYLARLLILRRSAAGMAPAAVAHLPRRAGPREFWSPIFRSARVWWRNLTENIAGAVIAHTFGDWAGTAMRSTQQSQQSAA